MKNDITNEQIMTAFGGTSDFGAAIKTVEQRRNYLLCAVMKKAMGYHCGHVITCIMKELQLLNKAELPNAKGRVFLRELYIHMAHKP